MTQREDYMHRLLNDMLRIRLVEEAIAQHYGEQQMRCPVHLSIGQEAPAVGVCAALQSSDWVFSGHRNHAHYLAKGGDLKRMLAELYGKATGCCGGKGGSMHLTDLQAGFIGATPIVGSTVPIAVGAAFTAQQQGNGRVVVIFLGDGAMEAGVVFESLNFAALKNLPVLFVCENNLYSVYSPLSVRQPSNRTLGQLAQAHGISVTSVDGNDVVAVYDAACSAVSQVRTGSGPVFLELPTYRWREHCGPNFDNDIGYRSEAEYQQWKTLDPIVKLQKVLPGFSLGEAEAAIQAEIQDAFAFAKSSPFPDADTAGLHVYADSSTETAEAQHLAETQRSLTYAEALNEAQDFALSHYENSYLMGLGVPDPKAIFGSTLHLVEKHGSQRVFDIPLSESALTGVALGSAITGMRPIMTHQRVDFALVSVEQIVNQAAKWHYMFGGQMSAPVVIRMIVGRGWGQGPQHSQSLHAWFAHVPGLRVIMPATPYDAKGMLIAAIEDNNPVLCLEHRWLYGIRDLVPEEDYRVPLDKARVVRAGTDVTLVGVSYMTLECLRAAELLAERGVSAEVVDLRSIRPIDSNTICTSVEKTGFVVVVDHASLPCSVASEVSAIVTENLFDRLRCAPQRMGLPDYPTPTSPALSAAYYPVAYDIANKVLAQLDVALLEKPATTGLANHDQPNASFHGPF